MPITLSTDLSPRRARDSQVKSSVYMDLSFLGRGFLSDVTLQTAHNGQQIGDITSIERCDCPSNYVGQFCESCAPGYRRETPFGGPSSECIPCECNGHSDTCHPESGEAG